MRSERQQSKKPDVVKELRRIIVQLQGHFDAGKLNSTAIRDATQALASIEYQYDGDKFPQLTGTTAFTDDSDDSPKNLAEALLWKLGKWNSYKKFALQYADDDSSPGDSDVIFFAFARHLKDKKNPIFDQHTLRAVWAIGGIKRSPSNVQSCRHFLVDSSGKWKSAGSGANAKACYAIFIDQIAQITKAGAKLDEIDRLLMPLGQAIKKEAGDYKAFQAMCSMNT